MTKSNVTHLCQYWLGMTIPMTMTHLSDLMLVSLLYWPNMIQHLDIFKHANGMV